MALCEDSGSKEPRLVRRVPCRACQGRRAGAARGAIHGARRVDDKPEVMTAHRRRDRNSQWLVQLLA